LSYHRLNTCEKRPRDAKPDACDRCGLCCKYVIIPLDRNVRSWKLKFNPEWMAIRGIRIIQGNLVLPCTCPELEPPVAGVPATCRCYKTRPTICRILSCKKDLLRIEPGQDLRGPAAATL
jgi:Fe-S-cluster containining protein